MQPSRSGQHIPAVAATLLSRHLWVLLDDSVEGPPRTFLLQVDSKLPAAVADDLITTDLATGETSVYVKCAQGCVDGDMHVLPLHGDTGRYIGGFRGCMWLEQKTE